MQGHREETASRPHAQERGLGQPAVPAPASQTSSRQAWETNT